MTVFVPLGQDATSTLPPTPSFLVQSPSNKFADVVKAVTKAKRIVVVSGAGISVQAGIPDFRSSSGLFNTLKRENPKDISSGKDLFDASVFTSEQTTSKFYQMIARLSDLSLEAKPTPFHELLRTFDKRGQLLRLYTQNIDCLEEKVGLSFGVPQFEDRPKPKRPRTEPDAIDQGSTMKAENLPKCIPLHGSLQKMHCSLCSQSVPLPPYVAELYLGSAPSCPACTSLEATRQLVGKRLRGIGRLRPSVVLYGEVHREGEGVGEVVRRDLVGKGTGKGKGNKGGDLLIVVGTSLRVPGTKRIVREFAKSVKTPSTIPSTPKSVPASLETNACPDTLAPPTINDQLPTPAPSPRRSPVQGSTPPLETAPPIRTIFINYDFPLPSREWEGVFDVWLKGDAQEFAKIVADAIIAKDEANLKKRKRPTDDVFGPDSPTKPHKAAKSASPKHDPIVCQEPKKKLPTPPPSPTKVKRKDPPTPKSKPKPLKVGTSIKALSKFLVSSGKKLPSGLLTTPVWIDPDSPETAKRTRSQSFASPISALVSPSFSDTPLANLFPSPPQSPSPSRPITPLRLVPEIPILIRPRSFSSIPDPPP